jgi:hypothetical protein
MAVVAETGSGPDTIVLNVSSTQYAGVSPTFTAAINGQPIGGVFTANAQHGTASDAIVLHGTWGPDAQVSVHYTNDDFDRSLNWGDPTAAMAIPNSDRNLYLDSTVYNGTTVTGGTKAIYDNRYDTGVIHTVGVGHDSFDTLDAAAKADPNFDVNQYLANGGYSNFDVNSYIAGGDGVSTGGGGKPVPVNSNAFDFNGATWNIQHVEDFGHPEWIHNLWGDSNIGADGVTSSSGSGSNFSGAMQPVGSASAGEGYGLYLLAVQFDVQGDDSGPYACLWPATDGWPGPEIDLLEFLPGTSTGYATLHWNDNGHDAYKSTVFNGVDFNHETHFVWADWEDGSLTFGVDDRAFVTLTDHVPKDFAHGGENELPGIGSKNEGAANSASMFGLAYATHADGNSGVSLGTLTGAATDHPLL